MNILPALLKEMEAEAIVTRKMLKLVPAEKFAWKPHDKSMSFQNLAVHLAELPSWVSMGLTTPGIDFAAMDYKPTEVKNNEELIALFEASYKAGHTALQNATEDDLLPEWTMRSGDKIHRVMTKYEVVRHSFSQTTHHRAQLGVYLRLNDIAIPGSYGPSADDMNF